MSDMWIGYEKSMFGNTAAVIYHGHKPSKETYVSKFLIIGSLKPVPEDLRQLPLSVIEEVMKSRGLL
jgi:hypothetical protein